MKLWVDGGDFEGAEGYLGCLGGKILLTVCIRHLTFLGYFLDNTLSSPKDLSEHVT